MDKVKGAICDLFIWGVFYSNITNMFTTSSGETLKFKDDPFTHKELSPAMESNTS